MTKIRRQIGARGAALAAALAALALGLAGCRGGSGSGQIRVTTAPEGATLTCNGAMQDVTPTTVSRVGPGTYLLVANKQGFREARRTVSLVSEGQRVAVEMKLEPMTGLVLVQSKPEGADVTVDGAFRGKTPFFMTDLPAGEHRLKFTASGYLYKEIPHIVADRQPQKIFAELLSNAGTLVVRSEPAGAEVLLNGVSRGTTPCEIPDAPAGGEVTVEIRMDGYQPHSEQVKVQAQEKKEIMAALQPVPTMLSVVSIPDGARIYVDDQYRGNAPVKITDLQPGDHRVRADLPGHETAARTVSLRRQANVVEEFRMVKNSGKLVVVTEPAGVTVLVDGQERGKTVPSESDVVSAPLEIDLLSPGEHTVHLLKKGYAFQPKKVKVGPNDVVDVHEKLSRRYIPDTRVRMRSGAGEVVRDGMVLRIFPSGDVEFQLETGTIMTIRKADIISQEPIRNPTP